jgi:hypothetical protein
MNSSKEGYIEFNSINDRKRLDGDESIKGRVKDQKEKTRRKRTSHLEG